MIQFYLKDGTLFREMTEQEHDFIRRRDMLKLPGDIPEPHVNVVQEIRFVRDGETNRYIEAEE